MLRNRLLCILSVMFVVSCHKADLNAPTAINAIGFQPVVTLTGYNAETKELIVVDTLEGKAAAPCGEITISPEVAEYNAVEQSKTIKQQQRAKSGENNCASQILNPSPELSNILALSKSGIKGSIIKDGEVHTGVFKITASFIYTGSYCETTYGGGSQYERCVTIRELCIKYQPHFNRLSQSDQDRWNLHCPHLLN